MWFLQIERLFTPDQLNELDRLIAQGKFVDGKLTAGRMAAQVKNNDQLDRAASEAAFKRIDEIVLQAINSNAQVRQGALPSKIAPPLVARYSPGKEYGLHSDNPLMASGGGTIRTDVSMTIFLSPPESYDGGALEIETTAGRLGFKLPRGDALMYPSGELHRVAPVTKGERLVIVTWLQSRIADARKRGIVYDVGKMGEIITNTGDPQSPAALLASKVYGDLVRMWAEN